MLLANSKQESIYTYQRTIWVGIKTHIIVTCVTHGDFKIRPDNHLQGFGCDRCNKEKKLKDASEENKKKWILKAEAIFDTPYLYDRVNYNIGREKVDIGCPVHGYFTVRAEDHVRGIGCPCCKKENKWENKLEENTKKWIQKAEKEWGTTYKYDRVLYGGVNTNVDIGCPTHGYFKQRPDTHIAGHGCPNCINKTEGIILLALENVFERVVPQYSTNQARNHKGNLVKYDFLLPDFNCCCECDGRQHFEDNKRFKSSYIEQQNNDLNKQEIANSFFVSMVRFNQEDVYNNRFNVVNILKEIKQIFESNSKIVMNIYVEVNKLYDSYILGK